MKINMILIVLFLSSQISHALEENTTTTNSIGDEQQQFNANATVILSKTNSAAHCETQYFNKTQYGWFASLNFPMGYTPGFTCDWIIDLGRYDKVVLRIKHVHLLSHDELSIFDGLTTISPLLASFKGKLSSSKKRVISSSGSVLVRLQSNTYLPPVSYPWIKYEIYGFNITYQLEGMCIPGEQRHCISDKFNCYDVLSEACDGVWDCPEDGSDEWNCDQCKGEANYYCPKLTQKESTQLLGKRQWGVARCYTADQRCDGFAHCPGMQDERNCAANECNLSHGTWPCQSGECIYAMYRCDGVYGDCLDNSDEALCDATNDPLHSWRQSLPRPIILAIVIGSLVSGIIVTVTMAYVLQVRTRRIVARNREIFCNFNSPLQRLVEAELRRRQPPPRYEDAMIMNHVPDNDDALLIPSAANTANISTVAASDCNDVAMLMAMPTNEMQSLHHNVAPNPPPPPQALWQTLTRFTARLFHRENRYHLIGDDSNCHQQNHSCDDVQLLCPDSDTMDAIVDIEDEQPHNNEEQGQQQQHSMNT